MLEAQGVVWTCTPVLWDFGAHGTHVYFEHNVSLRLYPDDVAAWERERSGEAARITAWERSRTASVSIITNQHGTPRFQALHKFDADPCYGSPLSQENRHLGGWRCAPKGRRRGADLPAPRLCA